MLVKNNTKGFTLVELIIVIAIIAILAAIAIPAFSNILGDSQETVCKTNRQSIIRMYTYFSALSAKQPDLDEFQAHLDANGQSYESICPAHGEVVPAINGFELVLTCSVHGAETGPDARPADTRDVTYIFDPSSGKYIPIQVHDTGAGQKHTDINGKVIYYDGELYEKGYYRISAWQYSASIKDMDAYIKTITKDGVNPSAFIKLNIDEPAQVYDAATQTGHYPNKNNNTIIKQGQCYYIDFGWDSTDGPVLAMYTGSTGDAGWRGDLGKASNSGVWSILERK